MKKLLKIPWGNLNNKSIEQRFDIKSGISEIISQEIAIQLENIIYYMEFFIGYQGFLYNQIYKAYYVYNQNDYRVYNKMHISNEW